MNICVIGAGNMGGAIATGISRCHPEYQLVVTNKSGNNIDRFERYKNITCSTDNKRATRGADVIILAVKPYLVKDVVKEISDVITADQIMISVAGGVSLEELGRCLPWSIPLFRVIPNTAAEVGESMSFICGENADEKSTKIVDEIFESIGRVSHIEERLFPAVTALCSCGIAYAFRYIRAATEGAVQLGINPDNAREYICQTLRGAVSLLETKGTHPEEEIDKVTTPGGLTIKGLNSMERNGFSFAVIDGLTSSVK